VVDVVVMVVGRASRETYGQWRKKGELGGGFGRGILAETEAAADVVADVDVLHSLISRCMLSHRANLPPVSAKLLQNSENYSSSTRCSETRLLRESQKV
jgi:hypothetical protein